MQTSEMNPSVGTISDLASCGIDLPTRSALSARLIEQLFDVLNEFEINGLHAFADDYARLDWLQGKRVSVESGDGETEGVADGVDTDGALRIKTGDGVVRIRAGSVRLLAGDP